MTNPPSNRAGNPRRNSELSFIKEIAWSVGIICVDICFPLEFVFPFICFRLPLNVVLYFICFFLSSRIVLVMGRKFSKFSRQLGVRRILSWIQLCSSVRSFRATTRQLECTTIQLSYMCRPSYPSRLS